MAKSAAKGKSGTKGESKGASAGKSAEPKCFVLDTNVLLHNADALNSFADNDVILPMKVLDELDGFKSHNDELGRNSRLAIRTIDSLRDGGGLRDGVKLPEGGRLFVVSSPLLPSELGLEQGEADNRILAAAYALKGEGRRVVFVSKDINARVKADALGLVARGRPGRPASLSPPRD